MEINILGWKSLGLRCPDINLDLTEGGQLGPIALVQMPNGTGKTTTLELIKACLDGSALNWGRERVLGFQRRHNWVGTGSFALDISLDDDHLTIEIVFDFRECGCSYRTSKASAGGVRDGWKIPVDLRPYCTEQFINLVVFDGELAGRLLDSKQTEAERAIDALCDLDFLIDGIPAWADSLWRDAKRDGALSNVEISRIKKSIGEVQEQKEQLEHKLLKTERALDEWTSKRRELESERSTELEKHEELRKNHEYAEREHRDAKQRLDASIDEVMTKLTRPASTFIKIGDSLTTLKEGLDKARLPEMSSRQFFEEIVDQDCCICGTPFDDQMRGHVREKMGEYLSSETTAVLNVMKDSIVKAVSPDDPEAAGFERTLGGMRSALRDFYQASHRASQAKADYSGPGADEMRGIEQRIGQLTGQIEAAERMVEQLSPKLQIAKSRQEELDEQLAEAQDAKRLKQKVSKLKQICADAVGLVREKVKHQMLVDCNEMLPLILKDNPVQLRKIDGALQLADQDKASVGQTLAVGYVFLARLFAHATHRFPFVVDSPVGSLDNSVREQIGGLIPSLERQFVAFTISSERTGFVPGLEKAAVDGITFLTIQRSDGDSNQAALLRGREAFYSFHSDKEEGDV